MKIKKAEVREEGHHLQQNQDLTDHAEIRPPPPLREMARNTEGKSPEYPWLCSDRKSHPRNMDIGNPHTTIAANHHEKLNGIQTNNGILKLLFRRSARIQENYTSSMEFPAQLTGLGVNQVTNISSNRPVFETNEQITLN